MLEQDDFVFGLFFVWTIPKSFEHINFTLFRGIHSKIIFFLLTNVQNMFFNIILKWYKQFLESCPHKIMYLRYTCILPKLAYTININTCLTLCSIMCVYKLYGIHHNFHQKTMILGFHISTQQKQFEQWGLAVVLYLIFVLWFLYALTVLLF